MSYYMEKGDLPVWHKDYVANSTAHVDPFAKNPSNKFSKSSNGFTATSDYYLNNPIASTFSVGTDKFTGKNEDLVYKGCGLLYETTKEYTNGWEVDYTTGLQPQKGVSTNAANKCFHIVWEKGTLTMYRTTDNAICPVDSSDYVGGNYIYTFQNVPPLIYFEFVAGGGGGAGGANYCTGGGGGGGAGCCGILNFTSAVARKVGYFLQVGSSGYGSTGAFYYGPGHMPGNVECPPGGNAASSILRLNTSSTYSYIELQGGRGGKGLDYYTRKTYPVGGSGGQAIKRIYTGNTTSKASFTPNTFVDTAQSMYILKAVDGKDGTNGYYSDAQDQPQYVSLSDSFSRSYVTLDSSLILNKLSQQTCETSNDVTDYDKSTGGGYGGPSMLGAGGRSGTYDGHSSYRSPTTPSGYGGGGGGDKAGSDVSSGCPGAAAHFIMRWVPYS